MHYAGQKNVVQGCVIKTVTHATFDQIFLANRVKQINEATCLHLRVDHAGVLALRRDVMDLGHEVLLPQQGEQDVVHVDGQDVHEAAGAGGVHGVAGVVGVRPGVGPGCQAPVCRQIEHLLVRIFLAERQKTLLH